jgi:hypothetical protein
VVEALKRGSTAGPRMAAIATLVVAGLAFLGMGLAQTGGQILILNRGTLALLGLGVACLGAAGRTWFKDYQLEPNE